MSQAALSSELQASVDEFVREGGKITQLDWAGVPVDGSAIEPKPVRAFGRFYPAPVAAAPEPAVVAETVAEWCNRVASSPLAQSPTRADPEHVVVFERDWVPPPLPDTAQAPATVAQICEYFGVPVRALVENTADMSQQHEDHLIHRLRALRADARRVLASLDNLEHP